MLSAGMHDEFDILSDFLRPGFEASALVQWHERIRIAVINQSWRQRWVQEIDRRTFLAHLFPEYSIDSSVTECLDEAFGMTAIPQVFRRF